MDLIICYPKPRGTCIYVEFQARSYLTMQYGHTEMKMPCVALSPKKTKHNRHNDPALKKHLGVEVLREVSLQHCENHPNGWKKSSHHAHLGNPSNKGMISFCVVLVHSCPSRNWHQMNSAL